MSRSYKLVCYQLLLAENTERAGKIIGDGLEALRHQEMGPALVF